RSSCTLFPYTTLFRSELVLEGFPECLLEQKVVGLVIAEHAEQQLRTGLQVLGLDQLVRESREYQPGDHGDIPELSPGHFSHVQKIGRATSELQSRENL